MNTQPIRILIADDHTMLRDALTHMLSVHEDIEVVGSRRAMAARQWSWCASFSPTWPSLISRCRS